MIGKVIHVNLNRIQELKWNVDKNIKRETYVRTEIFPLLQKYGVNCDFYDAVMIPDFVYDRRGSELYVQNYDKFLKYNDENIKVGLNKNDPPRNYELALFLGHYNLWKECVKTNTGILIMEDDLLISEESCSYITQIIQNFPDDNKLLYLQSVSPSNPSRIKSYKSEDLVDRGDYYVVSKRHGDFSGTCCYYITPSSAKTLLNYVSVFGAICIDGFIHNCQRNTRLDICIPKHYDNAAKLHLEYC